MIALLNRLPKGNLGGIALRPRFACGLGFRTCLTYDLREGRISLAVEHRSEGTHWARDILQLMLAKIGEIHVLSIAELIANGAADADSARLGEGLNATCDVHAIAEHIPVLDHDIADIDADPKLQAL